MVETDHDRGHGTPMCGAAGGGIGRARRKRVRRVPPIIPPLLRQLPATCVRKPGASVGCTPPIARHRGCAGADTPPPHVATNWPPPIWPPPMGRRQSRHPCGRRLHRRDAAMPRCRPSATAATAAIISSTHLYSSPLSPTLARTASLSQRRTPQMSCACAFQTHRRGTAPQRRSRRLEQIQQNHHNSAGGRPESTSAMRSRVARDVSAGNSFGAKKP